MERKQTEIEGTQPKRIKEIEEAADAYETVRDRRMDLTKEEIALKGVLEALIVKHQKDLRTDERGCAFYDYDGGDAPRRISYEATTELRVRKIKDEDFVAPAEAEA